MAGITLSYAIKEFVRELGCPDDRDSLINRVTEAIEWLLFNGGGDILHEWKIPVRRGKTTLPRTLETPVKYKFEECAAGGFGTFVTPYSSYSAIGIRNCVGFSDWEPLFEVKANRVATEFTPPPCGVQLVLTTTNDIDCGTKASVAGRYGNYDIAPTHNGFPTAGEILTVYHQNDSKKKLSAYRFDEIASVVKDRTFGYVMLSGFDQSGRQYFLSHYHPDEEVIRYREIELFSCPTFANWDWRKEFWLYILGRVNPSIRYVRDEDILPIPSLELLKLLAKRAKYDEANDFQQVAVIEGRLRVIIKKNVIYTKAPGSSILQNLTMSGATQRNL